MLLGGYPALRPPGHRRVKKKNRRAVDRNFIKRMVREVFRRYRLQIPARDYLIYFHGEVGRDRSDAVRRSLQLCFQEMSQNQSR